MSVGEVQLHSCTGLCSAYFAWCYKPNPENAMLVNPASLEELNIRYCKNDNFQCELLYSGGRWGSGGLEKASASHMERCRDWSFGLGFAWESHTRERTWGINQWECNGISKKLCDPQWSLCWLDSGAFRIRLCSKAGFLNLWLRDEISKILLSSVLRTKESLGLDIHWVWLWIFLFAKKEEKVRKALLPSHEG